MFKQIFNADINKMTVADLKSVIRDNKWSLKGLRLKSEFRKFIITSSYNNSQYMGIALMKEAG